MKNARDYDVMVIGGGGAGVMAAIHASFKGASVCLLEANPKLGGSFALSGGLVLASGTTVQKEAGVNDSPEQYLQDVLAINAGSGSVDPEAVARVCYEGGAIIEWLATQGIPFQYDPFPTPRCHAPEGFGEGLFRGLATILSRTGVDVALQTRVTQLLTDDSGAVIGAEIDGEAVRAGAVVLSTGGYGGNPDMVKELMPRSATAGDWLYYIGNPANVGDGIKMGQAVGAAFMGRDQGLISTNNGFHFATEPNIPSWLLVVNEQGQRFGNEDSPYWVMPELIREQTNQRAFAIFDSRMFNNPRPDRRLEAAFRLGFVTLSWMKNDFEEYLAKKCIKQAQTIEELAEQIGITSAGLAATVDRYNSFCETGEDLDVCKEPIDLEPVEQAPFYAIEIRNHVIWVTQGGLPIDKDGRVLREKDGKPIPGLYAAGEITGNVLGAKYPGTGFSNANSLVFGKVAGEAAAAYAGLVTQNHAGQ